MTPPRYENCCRLCGCSLHGKMSINCVKNNEIAEAIFTLFKFRVSRSDTSRCICPQCFETLMGFKGFNAKVQSSQETIAEYEAIKVRVLSRPLNKTEENTTIDLVEVEGSSTTATTPDTQEENQQSQASCSNCLKTEVVDKRIINVELHESFNNKHLYFEYFDESNARIDFESLTVEERADIAQVLYINYEDLKNNFKKLPPDENTSSQLDLILGANWRKLLEDDPSPAKDCRMDEASKSQ